MRMRNAKCLHNLFSKPWNPETKTKTSRTLVITFALSVKGWRLVDGGSSTAMAGYMGRISFLSKRQSSFSSLCLRQPTRHSLHRLSTVLSHSLTALLQSSSLTHSTRRGHPNRMQVNFVDIFDPSSPIFNLTNHLSFLVSFNGRKYPPSTKRAPLSDQRRFRGG